MPTVGEYVTANLPQTELDLEGRNGLADYGTIKTQKIALALLAVTGSADESAQSDLVRAYCADLASIDLLNVAADFYKSKSMVSRSAETSSLTDYDRVAYCLQRIEELQRRVLALRPRVDEIVVPPADGAAAGPESLYASGMTPITTWDGTRVTANPHRYGTTVLGRTPRPPGPYVLPANGVTGKGKRRDGAF
jgi:hypothetical protein